VQAQILQLLRNCRQKPAWPPGSPMILAWSRRWLTVSW
jgi:hypothetical protein